MVPDAAESSLSFRGHMKGFTEILISCGAVLIQTLSSEIPSQVSDQPL